MLVIVAFLALTAVAWPHSKIQKEDDDMPQEYYMREYYFCIYVNCVRTCMHNN